MKYILSFLISLLAFTAVAQTPGSFNRSSPAVIANDARLKASMNLIIPVLSDTTLLSAPDSLGYILYVRNTGRYYVRDSNRVSGGHRWGLMLKDSVPYERITNTPSLNPGVYFSPGQNANPGFMVSASAIVYPTNAFVNGTPIVWGLLDHVSEHNSSFFDSAYGNTSTQQLILRFPKVRQVFFGALSPDETFSRYCVMAGGSVGTTTMDIPAYQPVSMSFKLTGNGAGTWTITGLIPNQITTSTHSTSTGITGFNLSTLWGVDYGTVGIQYQGPRGYRIQRQYTGLGIYNGGFKLLDSTGNVLTTNPLTTDEIVITNAGMSSVSLSMGTWSTNRNQFMIQSTNWWVRGLFEAWMVAQPVSTTSIQVRWQQYPSATSYKIYRSSTGLYGAFTLIYSGTDFSYVDGGLTANARYTYKMVAVVGGVDTDVTTFSTNTKY